ncbi:MAG: hypothetical protein ACP5QG_03430 [candidate division WOR-3 bacterium]
MMIPLLLAFIPETEANPYAMAYHRHDVASVCSTGAKWVRMWQGDGGAHWGSIQPTSLDSFYWDEQDDWIRWADTNGFNIMLTVTTGSPEWVGNSLYYCKWVDSTHIPAVDSLGYNWFKASFPPQDYRAWYNFVYALVSRYDGNTPDPKRPGQFLPEVRYWELVPEPDHWGYWYGTKETYFDLFVPTFVRAVRTANPNAVIVGPSMTGYSIAWAVIKEMVDSGVDTTEIVKFCNSHIKYTDFGWWGWGYIKSCLDTSYKKNWQINFVNYAYSHAWLYDKWGFHDYENWETSPILRDYENRHLAMEGYHLPFWWTELGHDNIRPWWIIPEPEVAARTWKKMINAFSSGVEWVCYSPMFPIRGLGDGNPPLYDDTDPWNPKPLEAKTSFAFIAGKINEQTGFGFTGSDTVSHSYLFWFTSDSLPNYTLVSAWADSGITDTIRIPTPPGTQSATLYDYLGNPINLPFSDSVEIELTWQPVMLEFYHTLGSSEGKPRPNPIVKLVQNPCRGEIRVFLSLPMASDVIFRLYDPIGRLILIDEKDDMTPGEHRLFFPAKPGVYFLETRSGASRVVMKAIVE